MAHNTKARSKTTEIRSSSNDLIQDRFLYRNLCRTSCTNLIDEIRKNKLKNTQADCVDTTGIVFKLGFWDSDLVSTHRIGFWDRELVSTHRWIVSTPL
ncbi:hypothetical protein Taro_005775 [Colocasia esculenta]|uniref:Uncharacterized protein n=1 Tax=Colocasia esculenta TaxID=4460 RepID=A0A843TQS7_COLES|nr:hypothetical protein [Colocasia esculenta]